jgi:hypothetical protein
MSKLNCLEINEDIESNKILIKREKFPLRFWEDKSIKLKVQGA